MKTKIKLYEVLTEKEQDEIYEIVRNLKSKIGSKELTANQAFTNLKFGPDFKEWINNLERKDEFYNCFIPKLHKRLLDGYKNIFQELVDDGVLIASNAGTQLGIIRDEKIIEWDDDIDLVMDIKDFNKYKNRIRWNALKNGWLFWGRGRDWIKDDFTNYKNKGMIWTQLFSLKRFEFDFGKFKTSLFPFIDIFPGIRVSTDIEKSKREEISLELVKYYNNHENEQEVRKRFSKNKKIEREASNYYSMLNDDQNFTSEKMKYSGASLTKILRDNYDPSSSTLMQLHPATPVFSNFEYKNMTIKEIEMFNEKYRFIISDNYEEQLSTEYGSDWRTPKKSHTHIILPWFIKLSKNKEERNKTLLRILEIMNELPSGLNEDELKEAFNKFKVVSTSGSLSNIVIKVNDYIVKYNLGGDYGYKKMKTEFSYLKLKNRECLLSKNGIIIKYENGRLLNSNDINDYENLSKIIKLSNNINSVILDFEISKLDLIEKYRKNTLSIEAALASNELEITLLNEAIKIYNEFEIKLIHGDLNEGNILIHSNEIKLIDFENLSYSQWIYEYIVFIFNFDLNLEEINFLLKSISSNSKVLQFRTVWPLIAVYAMDILIWNEKKSNTKANEKKVLDIKKRIKTLKEFLEYE